jgi:hypothetical protein
MQNQGHGAFSDANVRCILCKRNIKTHFKIISVNQGDQTIWKKLTQFFKKVAKTVAKQNNAKLETIFKQLI